MKRRGATCDVRQIPQTFAVRSPVRPEKNLEMDAEEFHLLCEFGGNWDTDLSGI
jgi:hypothetical protein